MRDNTLTQLAAFALLIACAPADLQLALAAVVVLRMTREDRRRGG